MATFVTTTVFVAAAVFVAALIFVATATDLLTFLLPLVLFLVLRHFAELILQFLIALVILVPGEHSFVRFLFLGQATHLLVLR